VTDVAFSLITAPLDDRLNAHDRAVLAVIARFPCRDINDCVRAGDLTLNSLCRGLRHTPRPYVFAAVARLEDLGYLPIGAIR
jgi:hypothetical protein